MDRNTHTNIYILCIVYAGNIYICIYLYIYICVCVCVCFYTYGLTPYCSSIVIKCVMCVLYRMIIGLTLYTYMTTHIYVV